MGKSATSARDEILLHLLRFRPHDLRRIYWYIDGAVRASAGLVAAAR